MMFIDTVSQQKVEVDYLTVGTVAVYSSIIDMLDYNSCTLFAKAKVLAGTYIKLVQAETSSSATFASDIVEHTNVDDYIKSNQTLTTDAIAQMNLTAIDIVKKIGLTDAIVSNRRYLRFKFIADADASGLALGYVLGTPKHSPVNQ